MRLKIYFAVKHVDNFRTVFTKLQNSDTKNNYNLHVMCFFAEWGRAGQVRPCFRRRNVHQSSAYYNNKLRLSNKKKLKLFYTF